MERRNIIVNMLFGSHLYGTATPQSDTDYKGVFVPTERELILQKVPKSINVSTNKSNTKNEAHDVDNEIYSLNYFLQLALAGETVALDMLHAPDKVLISTSDVWEELRSQRHRFYTKNLKAFVGYARKQAAKYGVKGSRLAEAKRVLDILKAQPIGTRVEDIWYKLPTGEHLLFERDDNTGGIIYNVCGKKLIQRAFCDHYVPMLQMFVTRYGERAKQAEANEGVDWKAVSHAFRAAFQVKHILVDGGYTYPLPETEFILRVKRGELDFLGDVGPRLDGLMDELEALSVASSLPTEPDREFWENWLYTTLKWEAL